MDGEIMGKTTIHEFDFAIINEYFVGLERHAAVGKLGLRNRVKGIGLVQ
jgi:hypothetical protein